MSSTALIQLTHSTSPTEEFSGQDTSLAAHIIVTAVSGETGDMLPHYGVRSTGLKEAFVSSEGSGTVRSTGQPRAQAPFSSAWPI